MPYIYPLNIEKNIVINRVAPEMKKGLILKQITECKKL